MSGYEQRANCRVSESELRVQLGMQEAENTHLGGFRLLDQSDQMQLYFPTNEMIWKEMQTKTKKQYKNT